jgi:CheY-like chemotaxis protein
VKQSNGNISVYSEIGHGTTFKVYLPRETAVTGPETLPAANGRIPGGVETVLLVEDEGVVRCLARDILLQAGYTVLEAAGGHEALRLIQENPGPVDLVVTDVVMPHMSGRELVQQLIQARPGIRVLLMSGYTDDAVVRHGILSAETEFLQKPFTASGFAQKVRDVLDRM